MLIVLSGQTMASATGVSKEITMAKIKTNECSWVCHYISPYLVVDCFVA
jgi:hypothetical protein